MILSVSRRTDVPAFYSDWFYSRVKAKEVYVRNPMNFRRVSVVKIDPDVVDCIVFWTKNPGPMLDRLNEINGFNYYFQFTLNSYRTDIEPGLGRKAPIIDSFRRLGDKLGPDRIIWRYDPIFINGNYTAGYHIENFERLAERLSGYTQKCTVSFIDYYRKISVNLIRFGIKELSRDEINMLAENISSIATRHGLAVDTCAEAADLSRYDIGHASCVDGALIEKLLGRKIKSRKDADLRAECGCMASIDIGAYDSCGHGCVYCYANCGGEAAAKNSGRHNPSSPLLIGDVTDGDTVKPRR